LSGLRGFQFETQHTFLSLGQELDYLSLANGMRDIFFYGLTGIVYSAGGDIEARVGPSLAPDSIFGDTEFAFLLSMAMRLDPRWSIGWNLKVMTQNFNNYSGYGLGEDLGLQYRITRFTTLGLMIQDPFTFFSYDNNTSNIVPLTLRAGIAHHDESLSAKLDGDLEWSVDLGFRPHLGAEWRPAEVLALRAGFWAGNISGGVSGGSLSFNPTAGIGFLIPMGDSLLELDYTLMTDRIDSGALLHQIDLTGKFL
jgi:hypothetical protein